MARALNKNKKPESIIKRARNYFWGSFGSPCGFCFSAKSSAYTPLDACSQRLSGQIGSLLHHPPTKC